MTLKLRIRVGPSYDPSTLTTILPNNDDNPFLLTSEHFIGHICIRIRDYNGVVLPGQQVRRTSPWFDGNNEQYSIQVHGRFKGDKWTGDDIVFGNDFDQPIRLPPGSWIGLKILQFIDPGLEADVYSPKPWAYSPFLVTMNAIRLTIDNSPSFPPWPSPNGEHIAESISLLDQLPSFPSARRRYFSNKENRERLKITEDQVWDLDFFNAYIDFDKFAVKLPGFEIGVMKYWDGQPLRYVCKSRDASAIFFVVVFELIEEDETSE
ncbi:11016_t:CDS:2 [Paraglomus occultum]|uniref:11016_t:CDS:1 n=1 Tax=Paraglomus occultum TaxID=144539 RepID=A0A9N9BEJ0_9GLOM|nr:11016_t:CDS:2 [Paraglomus occultum]